MNIVYLITLYALAVLVALAAAVAAHFNIHGRKYRKLWIDAAHRLIEVSAERDEWKVTAGIAAESREAFRKNIARLKKEVTQLHEQLAEARTLTAKD